MVGGSCRLVECEPAVSNVTQRAEKFDFYQIHEACVLIESGSAPRLIGPQPRSALVAPDIPIPRTPCPGPRLCAASDHLCRLIDWSPAASRTMQIERHGQIVRGRGPNSGCTQLSEVSRFSCATGRITCGEIICSVAFPMNQRAEDLMMGAPSEVAPKQLRELHIRVV